MLFRLCLGNTYGFHFRNGVCKMICGVNKMFYLNITHTQRCLTSSRKQHRLEGIECHLILHRLHLIKTFSHDILARFAGYLAGYLAAWQCVPFWSYSRHSKRHAINLSPAIAAMQPSLWLTTLTLGMLLVPAISVEISDRSPRL